MRNLFKLDSWLTGVITGLAVPATIYFGGRTILHWQGKYLGAEFNESFSLFAFAMNGAIVYFFMNKKGRDRFGKGIIAATFVYVFIWIFKYHV
ncbi:MAG: hypothetical protein JKY53_09860 [Flavobacteriales bacterium]|nr:hypothetical protein [Flavobacteriales bacterium]